MAPPPSVHPELRRLARFLPRNLGSPMLGRLHRLTDFMEKRNGPPDGVERVAVGPVQVWVHRRQGQYRKPAPGVVWIHGGGYIGGSPSQDDRICRRLATELGAVVAAPAYRKAPAHPFPTALHDCHDVLAWLAEQGDVDPERIAIGGASAGGGLAAALALLARERGEVQPVLQLLSYPMLDDRTTLRTDVDETGMRLWGSKSNRYGWSAYLGREPGGEGVDPLAAPARHEQLAGLPPAWIGVGTLDLFHDEDLAYARRLDAAGVPCDVLEVDGAFHGFDSVAPRTDVSRAYQDAMFETFRRYLS